MSPGPTSHLPPVVAKAPPARRQQREAAASILSDERIPELSVEEAAAAPPESEVPPVAAPPPLQRVAPPPRAAVSDTPPGDLGLDDVEVLDEVEEVDDVDEPSVDDAATSGAEDESADEEPSGDEAERSPWFSRVRLQGYGACCMSITTHAIALIVMAYLMVSQPEKPIVQILTAEMFPDRTEEDLLPAELDMQVEASSEIRESASTAALSAVGDVGGVAGATGVTGGSAGAAGVSAPTLDRTIVDQAVGIQVSVAGPLDGAPSSRKLISGVPDGALGDPRAIVDDYDQAMDRITQEVLWMLSKSNVLLIWCFDQSESMKDDQQEIRARIRRVYSELGLRGQTGNDALTTAVTSFGSGFNVHTRRPTSDVTDIEAAIESVPIDPSGKEFMCPAVMSALGKYLDYATGSNRQVALVLVTDESGDPESNRQYLEQAVAVAKSARAKVYVLGREAVFGYPYANMRWRHPFTGVIHWLPIDRGPETAFVEQLQTEGFRKRTDAFPSGFGPYEQTRLAYETGGIFFMLPGLETNLVRGEKRRYELEQLRAYGPDLRQRQAVLADRDQSRLRSVLWKIINDLNPYVPEIARAMEVDFVYAPQPAQFLVQARREQAKAKIYISYLNAAAAALEEIRFERQQETSPRWQANYDLVYAQVLAYMARTYEYGAYLDHFIASPKIVPFEKPTMLRLSSWHIAHSKRTVGGSLTDSLVARSRTMFQEVIARHPGTPWAARAEWELSRGCGVELQEHYSYYGPRPPEPPRPTVPNIPIPKL